MALLGGLYYTSETLRVGQETLRGAQDSLHLNHQGQITERFTKAESRGAHAGEREVRS